jgi:hypothetical protein
LAIVGHYLPVGVFLHSGYLIEAANFSRLNLGFAETTVRTVVYRDALCEYIYFSWLRSLDINYPGPANRS